MDKIEERSKRFKALGEPIRLMILENLLEQKKCKCICELAEILKRDQSVIYRHVQILKDVGLVDACKETNRLMCCLKDPDLIRRLLKNA